MKTVLAPIAACLMMLSPALAAQSDGALRAALQSDLNQYLQARTQVEHISAISLSVSLHGSPSNINLTTGRASLGGNVAVTPDSLFQIGSNTKAFTAVALLQMEAAGKLSMQDTVGKWLPQYPAWKNISITRLLNMTSGIPEYLDQPALLKAIGSDPNRRFQAPELVSYVDPRQRNAPRPTTGYHYSNSGYILAQMIIERTSGHSYEQEIQRRFLRAKLGLTDTYYASHRYPASVTDRMVSGYFYNLPEKDSGLGPLIGKDLRLMPVSWAQAAGGMVSRPENMTRWARALYVGDLLTRRQRRELTSIVSLKTGKPIEQVSAADPHGFGLGVVQSWDKAMGAFWFYEGETLGYRTVYFYLPRQDAAVAVSLNSQPANAEDHVGRLMQSVWRTLHQAGKL